MDFLRVKIGFNSLLAQNALFSVCYIARRFWFCFVRRFKRGR
ncbi:hypothetical protein HMPREF1397_01356 [Helicobacter pylori GAM115Ai]|nr:hypothetical protein HMPREF1397_01356 [Helicobacter pylori GAM115Ai]